MTDEKLRLDDSPSRVERVASILLPLRGNELPLGLTIPPVVMRRRGKGIK